MNQFFNIIWSLLRFSAAFSGMLILCNFFGFYKKKEDHHNHGDSILKKEDLEMHGEYENGLLLWRKLNRIKSMLRKLVNDKLAYQKLQTETDQTIMAKVIHDLTFRRKEVSRVVKELKKVVPKFTKLCDEIVLRNLMPPSSPKCLSNIMPLELWEAVANHSCDAQSWLNIYYMNPVLQTLLKRKRTTALLPEILKIVYGTVSRDALGLPELSQCRLVCKNWRICVDGVLGDPDIRLAFCQEYSSSMMTWTSYNHPTSFAYSFMPESVERLLLEPYAGIRPFPSGHLVVYEIEELTADIARFRLSVSKMLRKFGNHVKYFGFKNYEGNNRNSWYLYFDYLTQWLRLMPNLKRLDLEFCMDAGRVCSQEYFNVVNFPRLENLTVLQVENVPGPVVSCALRSNPQIQKLRIIRDNIHFPPWEIPMSMNSLSHFFILAYSYRDIMRLEKIDSPLQAIQIETSASSTGIYNAERVFIALSKFYKSLNYLKLELQSPPDTGLFLHLPLLDELNLIFHADIMLDFILPMRSLRKLSVKILNRRFRPGKKFEIIKFNCCIENMKESNVWDLFPQLEIVTIYAYNCRFQFNGKHTFVCRRSQVGF